MCVCARVCLCVSDEGAALGSRFSRLASASPVQTQQHRGVCVLGTPWPILGPLHQSIVRTLVAVTLGLNFYVGSDSHFLCG